MGETPMSALTLLCSGIQLYSAEQRRTAHCGLHPCRCKVGGIGNLGRAGAAEPGLGSHGDPAVPQTRL